MKNLSSVIRTIGKTLPNLPKEFPKLYSRDPAKFKRRVLRLLSRALFGSEPGRPCLKEVTLAIEMRAQGKTWAQVYPLTIGNYARLSPGTRTRKAYELRNRVRSRESKHAGLRWLRVENSVRIFHKNNSTRIVTPIALSSGSGTVKP